MHNKCNAAARYNRSLLRLIRITAHPDDEAAGFGGSLLLYGERGVETSVVCLTPGQAATHRGNARNDRELAEARRQEFAEACSILKVSRGLVLDYPDGQLHRQDLCNVARELTRHIREFRPHVLLTFGPEGGGTGHTDHSMASSFATLAYHWAGREGRCAEQLREGLRVHRAQKLYYQTADFALPGRPPISLSPITAAINIERYFPTKMAAFKAHLTQAPLWPIFEQNMALRGPREMFHLAACVNHGSVCQETDLFDGVRDDLPKTAQ